MSLRTSGRLFWFVLFSLSQKIIPTYAQVCKCDWTKCNAHKMQTADQTCEQNSIWRLKKSILFILPDILMFNMRVLYYHDDNDYSCAILVYCCLNVTLFFYDMMSWKLWAWEWWPSFKNLKSYFYTESECCRWIANSCQVKSSIVSHGALLLFSRCTILNAVLLYYLDDTLSNSKM